MQWQKGCAVNRLIKFALVGFFFASSAEANGFGINVNFGAAFSKLGNKQIVTPITDIEKSYTATNSAQTKYFAGGGVEYVFNDMLQKPISFGLGLSAYYIGLSNIAGTEIPGSNIGLTDPLNYRVQAYSVDLLFEPKLAYTQYSLQPYVLTGVGCTWNTLKNFSESTPSDSYASPGNPYANHTESNFSYELGLGLQYKFMIKRSTLFTKIEYRYLNLNDAQLGAAAGQTTSDRFISHNIAVNVVDFGLGYQI